jgi:SAM-dependent methyltransferase
MGSQAIQGKFWGQRAKDWAAIQEQTGKAGYDFVLDHFSITSTTNLLDIGCGTGYFCKMAADHGAWITGIDASPQLIDEAKQRVPKGQFVVGEMEELPFDDNYFDIVCGFNSFQYAGNTLNALTEAKRVLKHDGKLVAMIWGNKQDCEAASYLKAVGSLLPPPPPGAAGPFALSENQLLELTLKDAGLKTVSSTDIPSIWDYPDTDTALLGLLSAGPVAKAIEHKGFQQVYDTILAAIQPYVKANGHVVYHNTFRVIIAEK